MKKFFTLFFATFVALTMNAEALTVAQAIEEGMKLDSAATSEVEYTIEGFVINAQEFSITYGNQIWYMVDAVDAAESDFYAYGCVAIENNDTLKVLNGDKVQLTGKLFKYWNRNASKFIIEVRGGVAEFVSKAEGDHTIAKEFEEITVAQALEIGAGMEQGTTSSKTYDVVGYVTVMAGKDTDFSQYGNQTYWIADSKESTAASNADGAFEVYRGKADEEVGVGFKVKVRTAIKNYKLIDVASLIESEPNAAVTILEKEAALELPKGAISCDSAVALAKAIADPEEVKGTVEGPEVTVWGYVTYAYDTSDREGVVTQSAWLSDTKGSKSGVIQGSYLQIANMEAAVAVGDYVELKGTLAKYLKEGKDGKENTIVLEIINGSMQKAELYEFYIYASADPLYGSVDVTRDSENPDTRATLTAVPNYGYHFTQWTDGNTENPRTITLTQDTTLTAEFAKNEYTIATEPNDPTWGTTEGDKTVLYLDEVTISATPNYGYHFVQWSNGTTNNPIVITVTNNAIYQAVFAKNMYSITKLANATQGTIRGLSQAEYLDNVILTAEPKNGYYFVQWIDGNKDNPRTIELTQDTTLEAIFDYLLEGKCGKDNALTWKLDTTKKALEITGKGALSENYTYGIYIESLTIGNEVTSIGQSAFYGFTNLKNIIIGSSVKVLEEKAFANCSSIETITCYSQRPPTVNTYALNGLDYSTIVYVPADYLNTYIMHDSWGLYDVRPLSNPTDPQLETGEYNVLYMDKNSKELYQESVLLHIPAAPEIEGFTFLRWETIAGDIENGITIQAIYEADDPSSTPDEVSVPGKHAQKLIRQGNVYILRDDRTYTLTGQEVK